MVSAWAEKAHKGGVRVCIATTGGGPGEGGGIGALGGGGGGWANIPWVCNIQHVVFYIVPGIIADISMSEGVGGGAEDSGTITGGVTSAGEGWGMVRCCGALHQSIVELNCIRINNIL